MSFGWSLGDILAGIKILWEIYDSVSDGPLNASLECEQFFEEFSHITQCLEEWDRKAQVVQDDDSLSRLHLQLRKQCEEFIQRHILLIRSVNSSTGASRARHSTWLRRASFSREQIQILYQQVQWPFERKEVSRLRKKLMLFLSLATYHVSASTHDVTLENRDILLDIRYRCRASNLEVVNRNLDLVSLIIDNLRRLTNPLEPDHQSSQIDYGTLRQFEHALLPPQPIRAIEATRNGQHNGQSQIGEFHQYSMARSATSRQYPTTVEDNRVLLSERLQNFRQRSARPIGSSSNSEPDDGSSMIQDLLERLRDTRNTIGDTVGLRIGNSSDEHLNLGITDPRSALLEELEVWDTFGERVQYEAQRRENLVAQAATHLNPTIVRSAPIPIRAPSSPGSVSPMSSPPVASSLESWPGSPGSPQSNRGSFLHTRSPSTSSSSPALSIQLDRPLPVILYYQNQSIQGSIKYCSRSDDGEVVCITTISQDGFTEIRHSPDRATAGEIETSMKPYLDNSHVDKVHKHRVQFQGSHVLRILKLDNQNHQRSSIRTQPKYKFGNRSDYYEFQQLLLNKDIVLITDVELIKSKDREIQGRLETIRILVDPIYKSRSILYFRGSKTKDHKIATYVEWPINLFKEPKEPSARSKTLTLESLDGKSLSISKGGLSRRSTQGSVTTIGSLETASAAHSRLQERSTSKGIKGLIIDFYEATDCHKFWEEFVVKEIQFDLPGPALT
ncbi:hypothetical protein B0O99DRAFT_502245 [Bisporella sp. PMI_857]|nr:hypothetical protein B0O99DRAFT_502245 [Bisporella sp. PMI_857]